MLLAPGNHQGTTLVEDVLRAYLPVFLLEFSHSLLPQSLQCRLYEMGGSQPGVICPLRRHLGVSGDIFNCHD